MGHDDDIARVERASKHLHAARRHLEDALDELYDPVFNSTPDWVLSELNETLKSYGLKVETIKTR